MIDTWSYFTCSYFTCWHIELFHLLAHGAISNVGTWSYFTRWHVVLFHLLTHGASSHGATSPGGRWSYFSRVLYFCYFSLLKENSNFKNQVFCFLHSVLCANFHAFIINENHFWHNCGTALNILISMLLNSRYCVVAVNSASSCPLLVIVI